MEIAAQKKTLAEVLMLGQHVIPRYQRRYAWHTQNIHDFWKDITNSSAPHFLGSMVTSGNAATTFEVIDGQQRLTTATISLCVLRDLYRENNWTERVNGLTQFISFSDRNGAHRNRLSNSDPVADSRLSDNVLIQKDLRPTAPNFNLETLEARAYAIIDELLRNRIAEVEDQLAIMDSIRDSILETEVVYINVSDRRNAFTIFETLNDRGQSLTVMDLVKNLLLSAIPVGDETSSERKWSELVASIEDITLEGIGPDSFLRYSWNSRGDIPGVADTEYVENARIRRSILDFIEAAGDQERTSRSLIDAFHRDAAILNALHETLLNNGGPDAWRTLDSDWRRDKYEEISSLLYGILITGSSQPLPLLISLMRAYIDPSHKLSNKLLRDFLVDIERFQIRWSIAQRPSTSTIRRIYRQAASRVSASLSKSELRAAHAQFYGGAARIDASDAQFRDGLERLAYSRTRQKDGFKIRYILTRIEKSYSSSKLDLSRQMSLEHLQGLEGRSEATNRNSWIFKIGNLALLPPEVNSQLPREFRDKSSRISAHINPEDLELTLAIRDKSWSPTNSNARQKQICALSLGIWPKLE